MLLDIVISWLLRSFFFNLLMDLCVFSTLCFLDLLMDLSVTSYSQFLVCANIFLSFDPKPKLYSFSFVWINTRK